MKAKWLFNPFSRIAGWPALLIGLVAMALTAWLSSMGGLSFNGVLDAHLAPSFLRGALIMQGVAWVSVVLCMWLVGTVFSRTRPHTRLLDIAGTMAFSRLPLLLAAAVATPLALSKLQGNILDGLSVRDMAGIVLLGVVVLVGVAWMVALMYNAYATCFNLRGVRGALSFIGALISAEALSKWLLALLATAMIASPAAAKGAASEGPTTPQTAQTQKAIPEGQTIQQTAALFIKELSTGDTAAATAWFDDTMQHALPAAKLATTWAVVKAKYGNFVSADTGVEAVARGDYRIMMVPCKFASGSLFMQLAFNSSGYISGLYFK